MLHLCCGIILESFSTLIGNMSTDIEIDEAAGTFIIPSYACDEKKKDGFVYVIVAIKHLQTSGRLLPRSVKEPSNAKVNVSFEDQALSLIVKGEKGEIKDKNYRLIIRKLLHEIHKAKSYYKIDNGKVLLYLCKKENKSWYPELNDGLDAAADEVENQ